MLSLVMGPYYPPPQEFRLTVICCYSSVKTRSLSWLEEREQERQHSRHFSTAVFILPQPFADPSPVSDLEYLSS